MFDRELNIGDHIFKSNGDMAMITGKTKSYYTYRMINQRSNGWDYSNRIPRNGCCKRAYSPIEEWFYCDDPTAKALECAFNSYKIDANIMKEVENVKQIIGKAKYFLQDINDIEIVDVEER